MGFGGGRTQIMVLFALCTTDDEDYEKLRDRGGRNWTSKDDKDI